MVTIWQPYVDNTTELPAPSNTAISSRALATQFKDKVLKKKHWEKKRFKIGHLCWPLRELLVFAALGSGRVAFVGRRRFGGSCSSTTSASSLSDLDLLYNDINMSSVIMTHPWRTTVVWHTPACLGLTPLSWLPVVSSKYKCDYTW